MKTLFQSGLLILLAASAAFAQPAPQVQASHTSESLRGVSAVSRKIAWASGTHGTYLRTTDGGRTWLPAQVPGAESLDFRAVVAFSASEAFLMSAGPGEQSRIYHTSDAGQRWSLAVHQRESQRILRFHAFLGPQSRRRPRRSHPRRNRQAEIRTAPHR